MRAAPKNHCLHHSGSILPISYAKGTKVHKCKTWSENEIVWIGCVEALKTSSEHNGCLSGGVGLCFMAWEWWIHLYKIGIYFAYWCLYDFDSFNVLETKTQSITGVFFIPCDQIHNTFRGLSCVTKKSLYSSEIEYMTIRYSNSPLSDELEK